MPDDDQNEEQTPGRLRQMYEEKATEAAQFQAQLAELQKREVFRDAGLDLSKPLHQALAKAYDGDLDSTKVREYVGGLGLADSAPEAPVVPEAEREAHERIAHAAAGEQAPPPPVTGHEAFEREARELMSTAVTRGGKQLLTESQFNEKYVQLMQKHGMRTTWDNGRTNAPY